MSLDLGTYGADDEPATQRPLRAWRPRARRRQLALIPVALAVACIVIATGRAQADRAHRPADTALAYLRGVQRGDAAAARADLVVPSRVDTVLYDAEALRQQGGISGVSLVSASRHGNTARVRLGASVAGISTTVDLTLRASRHGVFRTPRWLIVGGLPTLRISAPAYEKIVLVDGRSVRLTAGQATVAVLPGSLTVVLPEQGAAGSTVQTLGIIEGERRITLAPTTNSSVRSRAAGTHALMNGTVVPDPRSGAAAPYLRTPRRAARTPCVPARCRPPSADHGKSDALPAVTPAVFP